jgi:tetratricopeptide (TPR) repeat protein
MSDPVIKGAKRGSSRPAPHSASQKSPARGGKPAAKSAKPKPKRAAAEKAPARKATPAKSAPAPKTAARPTPKQSKRPAAKPAPAKKAGGKPSASAKSAPTKSRPASKQPSKSAAKTAAAKPSKAQASKGAAAVPQRPASRHTPTQPRQPSRDEAAALKAFERAHKEFARGSFTTARDLFRSLIDQHGGVSEVTARARTYLSIAEARLQRESAVPRDPDSLYDRGVIELNRGDFVAAQEYFERALKRDPEAADTHYALAATRARLGAVEAALHALERAVELKSVLRVRAQSDADLAPLRNDPEFERIVFHGARP